MRIVFTVTWYDGHAGFVMCLVELVHPLCVVSVRPSLNSDLYCQQLERLKDEIAQKRAALVNRRGIVFH